jgi:hypothetical protein
LALSTNALNFGSVVAGQSSPSLVLTLTNVGAAALPIPGISLSDNSDYSVNSGCAASLPVSATCTLNVTFTPQTAGVLSGIVTFAAAPTGKMQVVALTGVGTAAPAPFAALSASALSFAGIATGTTSPAQSVTLTNSGSAILTGISVALTAGNTAQFAESTTCSASLAVGSSCQISVAFTPGSPSASYSATIAITDNSADLASRQAISLIGTSAAPPPAPLTALSTALLSFGPTEIGSTAPSQAINLTNPGNASLTGTSISIAGATPGPFAQTSTCGTSLPAGGSCSISVVFSPSNSGTVGAVLSISDSATGSPQTVALVGSGTAPAVTLSMTNVGFPTTLVGGAAPAIGVMLSNSGNAMLNITSIQIGGAGAGAFSEANTCGATVVAGTSCTVSLAFAPTEAGTDVASLNLVDNASNSPQGIGLLGTGATGAPYHGYGDSITAGQTLSSPSLAYPALIAQARGFTLADYAISGDQACDIPTSQIFPNSDNPPASGSPLYSLMVGTNDQDDRGADYLPVFNLCHQATIAWLALPADLKVLATSSNVTTSGPGAIETTDNWNDWVTGTLNASITFPISLTAPGPIYLWPRIVENDAGTFSYAVDGTVLGTFATYPGISIRTVNGTSDSMGFIRIPGMAAGKHTVTLTQTSTSGTMRIVAIGAPPSATRTLPTVIVTDPPLEGAGSAAECIVNMAICNTYAANVQANAQLFAGDGLAVRYIDNHPYMHGTASEMNDSLHPNALGQSELATALETVVP